MSVFVATGDRWAPFARSSTREPKMVRGETVCRRPPFEDPRMKRELSPATWEGVLVLVFLTVAGLAGLIGWFVGHEMGIASSQAQGTATPVADTTTAQTVSEQVAAGGHDFVQFACAQCHGEQGQGGISPDVPALTGAGAALTVPQLEHIIN